MAATLNLTLRLDTQGFHKALNDAMKTASTIGTKIETTLKFDAKVTGLPKIESEFQSVKDSVVNTVRIETSQLEKLEKSINDITKEIRVLNKTKLDPNTEKAKNEFDELGNEIKQTANTHQKYSDFIKNQSQDALKGNAQGIRTIRNEHIAWGKAISVTSMYARNLARAIRIVMSTGIQFQKQMSEIKAITGATNEELVLMSQKAREMGAATAFSATEAADGLKILAQTGMDAATSITTLDSVLFLTGAGGFASMNRAAELVASTMKNFGLEAGDSTRIADVLAKSMNISSLNATRLANSMGVASTTAGTYNQSLEETVAMLALFHDAGVTGSKAGTTFRNMLTRLVKPTRGARDSLEKMGISLESVDPSKVPVSEILQRFAEIGAGGEKWAKDMVSIFGTRYAGAIQKAVANSDQFKDKFLELANAAGTSADMYAEQMDNLAGDIAKFNSALEEVKLKTFDNFSDTGRFLVQQATFLITFWSEQIPKAMDALTRFNGALLKVYVSTEITVKGIQRIGEASLDALSFKLKQSREGFAEADDILQSIDQTIREIDQAVAELTSRKAKIEPFDKDFAENIKIQIDALKAQQLATELTAEETQKLLELEERLANIRDKGRAASFIAMQQEIEIIDNLKNARIDFNETFEQTATGLEGQRDRLTAYIEHLKERIELEKLPKEQAELFQTEIELSEQKIIDLNNQIKEIEKAWQEVNKQLEVFRSLQATEFEKIDIEFEKKIEPIKLAFSIDEAELENISQQIKAGVDIEEIAAGFSFDESEGERFREFLTGLNAWRRSEIELRNQEINQRQLELESQYFEQVKFQDENYYSWKRQKIDEELAFEQQSLLDHISLRTDLTDLERANEIANATEHFENIRAIKFDNLDNEFAEETLKNAEHIAQLQIMREGLTGASAELAKTEIIKDILSQELAAYSENIEQKMALEQLLANYTLDTTRSTADLQRQIWLENNRTFVDSLNIMASSFENFGNSLFDMEMTGKARREKLWADVTKGFQQMLVKRATIYLKQQILERVITAKTEATKQGIQEASLVKQLATEAAGSIKYLAIKFVEIAAGIAKFYSFLGPFAIPATAATMAGMVGLIKSFAGFQEGIVDFRGAGTETSDSNIVAISNRESVMTADVTKNNEMLLRYMNENPQLNIVETFVDNPTRIIEKLQPQKFKLPRFQEGIVDFRLPDFERESLDFSLPEINAPVFPSPESIQSPINIVNENINNNQVDFGVMLVALESIQEAIVNNPQQNVIVTEDTVSEISDSEFAEKYNRLKDRRVIQ